MFPAACISFSCTILFYLPCSIPSLYTRLPFRTLIFCTLFFFLLLSCSVECHTL
ncbi:hypothetical protein BDV11DRAFT_4529 [Aspergillus similis]